MNNFFFVNQLFQHPSVALQETSVDHNDPADLLDPACHARMGNEEGFGVACPCVRRHLPRDEVGGEPGNFSPDARSFAGQNGDFLGGDVLFRIGLAGGAMAFHTFNGERKIGRMDFRPCLLCWYRCDVWKTIGSSSSLDGMPQPRDTGEIESSRVHTSLSAYNGTRTRNTVNQLRSRQSCSRKEAAPSPQRNVDESDHHRHLHQRTDNSSKGRARVYTVDRHRHSNRELEIVAGRGE
jgi:hypothetical protein